MSSASPPAKAAPAPVAVAEPRKLDDVLLAMDVVDTLRHRERIVDMELATEDREAQLIGRLREIYTAQGIEVPDRILKDGVKALEEQRFLYKPPEGGFSVSLARLYVSRKHWLPGSLVAVGIIAAVVVGWQLFWAMPQAAEWRALPAEIARLSGEGQALAISPAVDAQIAGIAAAGERAVARGDRGEALAQVKVLRDMNGVLATEYDVRVVARPGEDTGFIREPDDVPNGLNHYLVVEAVAPGGRLVSVPLVNEETQKPVTASKWAQRVSEATFNRVAEDKSTDGIVQNDILGRKAVGELEPVFDAPTPGGVITEW